MSNKLVEGNMMILILLSITLTTASATVQPLWDIGEIISEAKLVLHVGTNSTIDINAIVDDSDFNATLQGNYAVWEEKLDDYIFKGETYKGVIGYNKTPLIIKVVISKEGNFYLGTFNGTPEDNLLIFSQWRASRLYNYADFDGNWLDKSVYKVPRGYFLDLDARQNYLASIFAEVYKKLYKKGYVDSGPTNYYELYNLDYLLENHFNRPITVIKSFIFHQQFDFSWFGEKSRPLHEARNAKWSPIANNPDQDANLSRSFDIDYQNATASLVWMNAFTDNGMHSDITIHGVKDPRDYSCSGGSGRRTWRVTYNPDTKTYNVHNDNCTDVELFLTGQLPTKVKIEAYSTWSQLRPAVTIAVIGNLTTSNHTESPSPGDDNNPAPMKWVIPPSVEDDEEELISEDDFNELNPDKWISWGSPKPRVLETFEEREGVFDNNGDGWCNSGIVSKENFSFQNGFIMESDIYLNVTDVTGCWDSTVFGLTRQNTPVEEGTCPEQYPGGITFGIHYDGDACWATPENKRQHAYLNISLHREDGESEGVSYLNADEYMNEWHNFKIKVSSNRKVEYYIDDKLIYASEGKLNEAVLRDQKIILCGQSSGSAGKAYHDYIKVYKSEVPPDDEKPVIPVFVSYPDNPLLTSLTIPPRHIFKLSDDEYHMFFGEQIPSGTYPADFNSDLLISTDGLTWDVTSIHRNVISNQQTGHTFNDYVAVLKENDVYKAWHSATSDWNIAGTKLYYSTSQDGIHYSGHGKVLDNEPYPEYDSRNINKPRVVFDGTTYHLYYIAFPGRQSGSPDRESYHRTIAYATSSDGIHWKKHGVVIDTENGCADPAVVFDGSQFEMLYDARDEDEEEWSVEYAVSYDGLNWEEIGRVDSINGAVVGLVKEEGVYKVWYRKKTESGRRELYYATTAPAVEERTLSITSAEVSSGSSTKVKLAISDATGLAGGDIFVKYDSDVITIGEVKGTDLISDLSLIVNKDEQGKLKLSMAGAEGIPSGSGALIEIELTLSTECKAETETTLELDDDTEIYDESSAAIPVNLKDGVVKCATCLKGDVNNDEEIRSNDAILALRMAANLMEPTDYQRCAADVNCDDKIRSNDAILILRAAAGLIEPSEFCPGAPSISPIVSTERKITITMEETHGVCGDTITVPLKGDNINELAGGDIRIAYDRKVLKAVDVSSASALLVSNITEAGIIQIAFAGKDSLNSQMIAEIEFEVVADDVSSLTFQSVELYSSDARPIDSKKIDGQFVSWAIAPEHNLLMQNFPNPFNPETWIPYQLKEKSDVTIRIYSLTGELVRTLNLGQKTAGFYVSRDRAAYWDGRNRFGTLVSSGVYFYQIKAGGFSAVKKLIVLK